MKTAKKFSLLPLIWSLKVKILKFGNSDNTQKILAKKNVYNRQN